MSQANDFQLINNTLTFINVGSYGSVEEAMACGGTYVSDDITALESYCDGFKTAFYDLQDALSAFAACIGHTDIKAYLNTGRGYICIDTLS